MDFVLHEACVEPGANLEARARAARTAALPDGVLTGHTADDQAETVILRLLRGSGSGGLSAMTPGPTHPILGLRRSETEQVCVEIGIEPVRDGSNEVLDMWRNRVRHELLPLASEIAHRDLTPILTRTADLLRDDDRLLDALAAVDRPDRRQGDRRRRPGARTAGTAALVERRRIPSRRGQHRTSAGRRPRRRDRLRTAGWQAGRTIQSAVPHHPPDR